MPIAPPDFTPGVTPSSPAVQKAYDSIKTKGLPANVKLALANIKVKDEITGDFIDAGLTSWFTSHGLLTGDSTVLNIGLGIGAKIDPADTKIISDYVQQKKPITGLDKPGLPNASDITGSLNPLAGLFQANIWIRVGEVVLGLILIAIGVAKMTNVVPIATKIAKMVK